MKTSILSNTLFFANSTREQVIEAFDSIEITVHSPDPVAHNLFCGKNKAYENVVGNLKSFQNSNTRLGIVYNITSEIFNYISNTIKRVIEIDALGIDHVVLQRVAPVGRAYKKDDWLLSLDAIESIFFQVEESIKTYGIDITLEDTFPLCKIPQRYKGYISSCTWGYDSCSLDMYGNVSKCCTDPRYVLGNILEIPLLDLWNTHPSLIEKRCGKLVPQKCRDCEQYEQCRGGCVLASEMNECLGDPLITF